MNPGQRFAGRYRLIRVLGRGGMGVVWHAKNEAIDRDVALKLMAPGLAANEDALRRFFNEARICGGIRHPGIVDVLDLGRAPDGEPFLVMELLEGSSVEKLLERTRRLAPADICGIVRDVATTVALAHQKGIIHRDLKPGNVFLHRGGDGRVVVKVLDFGISKVIGDGGSLTHTRTGMMLGTPSYMSPEQAGGRLVVDHRADVYAMGAILYEGLSGKLPFEAPSVQALIVDIAVGHPTPVTAHMPDLPPPLAQFVADCIERDRDRRIQTARDVVRRLQLLMDELGYRPDLDVLDVSSTAPTPLAAPAAAALRPVEPAAAAQAPRHPGLEDRFVALSKTTPLVQATPPAAATVQSAGVAAPVAAHRPAALAVGDDRLARQDAPIASGAPAMTGRDATVAPFSSSARHRVGGSRRPWLWLAVALPALLGVSIVAWRAATASSNEPAPVAAAELVPTAPVVAAPSGDPAAAATSMPSEAVPAPTATATAAASAAAAGPSSARSSRLPKPQPTSKPAPAASSRSEGMWGYE